MEAEMSILGLYNLIQIAQIQVICTHLKLQQDLQEGKNEIS